MLDLFQSLKEMESTLWSSWIIFLLAGRDRAILENTDPSSSRKCTISKEDTPMTTGPLNHTTVPVIQ